MQVQQTYFSILTMAMPYQSIGLEHGTMVNRYYEYVHDHVNDHDGDDIDRDDDAHDDDAHVLSFQMTSWESPT